MTSTPSYDYGPRSLLPDQDAQLFALANDGRLASGPALDAIEGDIDELMERWWINRHDAAGITWRCKVWIDDLDSVLAWAKSLGFRSPANRRRTRARLVHFIEDRLRDGEWVPTDAVTLRSEIRIHAGGPRPLASPRVVS